MGHWLRHIPRQRSVIPEVTVAIISSDASAVILVGAKRYKKDDQNPIEWNLPSPVQSPDVIKGFPLILEIFNVGKYDPEKENGRVDYQICQMVFLRFVREIEAVGALWYKNEQADEKVNGPSTSIFDGGLSQQINEKSRY